MLNKLIKFSLDNRIAIIIMLLVLLVAGSWTAANMEVDVFPDLNAPTVVVMTEAPGMAPEEVEKIVTFPLETAVNGATDVRRVRSSSTTGFSIVWVEFEWGTDIYKARQIVSERLAVVAENLPDYVGRPTLGPQASILGETMIVGLTSEGETSAMDLRTIADWVISPRLLSIEGVAQVTVLGGDVKEYQILLDPLRMKHFDISLSDVLEATDELNRNATGGVLYEYGNEYIIRGDITTAKAEVMAQTVVGTRGGKPVLLSDIAEVRIGAHSPKLGVASYRAEPAVLLTVTKQPNTNTQELTERLDASLAELSRTLPDDVEVHTDIFRQQRFIDASISNIQKALLEGGLFVVLVLMIFLMNVRTTAISLVTMPLALLVTILVLNALGLTMNTMSIGGMAIAIGSLVDDAIVDVENVYRCLRANSALPAERRRRVIDVVYDASREVRMPIFNSTLIIVASFIPLFFLSGMEGRMLAPLGLAFIVSLFASTFVALTLTPVLCSLLLGHENRELREPFITRILKKGYKVCLEWTLCHKRVVLSVTVVALCLAMWGATTLGRSFLPSFNEGSFTVNVSTLPGISIEESDKIGRRAEELLLSIPEVQTVARKTGRAEADEHALGVNTSEIEAPFVLDERSRDEVIAEVRAKLSSIPGANIEIGQPISHRIDAMLSGTRAGIAIKLFGTDLNHMYEIGNQIKSAISEVEGVADLNIEQQIERPQLRIAPRREVMARYGVTPADFYTIVETMLGGSVVSQVYDDGRIFDIVVKTNDTSRASMDNIRNMMVDAGGEKVPFSTIADITSTAGPNTINRENVARKIVISANVVGGDLRGAVNAIREIIDEEITLPEGYHVEYGGQFESEEAASRTLAITSILSILVIFMLLYGQFHNATQAAVVLLNLPLALIGGIVSLLLTSQIISIPAIIGFISLFGIATRNGMLLISRYNDLRSEGLSLGEAVLEGSLDRLNPILMTALTSALALIPLALTGDLAGNEIQSPMAQVILGGLVSSTLLNGFVIPIMYILINSKKAKQ
ncbi:MAG: efflux RND transporter permease subunit [Rikenellaceae bacterium]|nr:efflux RND transporter permease subunit [Rikenellaceae bacterium]